MPNPQVPSPNHPQVVDDQSGTSLVNPGIDDQSTISYMRSTLSRSERERYSSGPMLGIGGMGEVRLFNDQRVGRDVACKTLLPHLDSDDIRKRFIREARIQGQLEHPSIVPVYDIGITPSGQPYFTMRRLRGVSLQDVLEDLARNDPVVSAKYTRRRLLTLFISICLAVHYAHTRGVIHRDLKPGNIMLGHFGEVYILDWGLAKVLSSDSPGLDPVLNPDTTLQGIQVGSVGYMSPEQIRGDNHMIDARTDVYALGMIFFELLTIRPVHQTTNVALISKTTLTGITLRPSHISGGISEILDHIFAKSVALDPSERYATVRDFADEVEQYLDGDIAAEKRAKEAIKHYQTAVEQIAVANDPAMPFEQCQSARENAFRELLSSLALDRGQPLAQTAMLDLLLQTPRHLPPEAETALKEKESQIRQAGARLGFMSYMAFLAAVPLIFASGIRHFPTIATGTLLCIFIACLFLYGWKKSRTPQKVSIVLMLLNMILCSILSSWLGPFILVPSIACATTASFALHTFGRERWTALLIGSFSIFTPLFLEFLRLVPRSFEITHNGLMLFARAIEPHPIVTLIGLVYTGVGFIVGPALVVGQARDNINELERKEFLHSWYLRHLISSG